MMLGTTTMMMSSDVYLYVEIHSYLSDTLLFVYVGYVVIWIFCCMLLCFVCWLNIWWWMVVE